VMPLSPPRTVHRVAELHPLRTGIRSEGFQLLSRGRTSRPPQEYASESGCRSESRQDRSGRTQPSRHPRRRPTPRERESGTLRSRATIR
jgi:hypothetical protein